MEMARDDAMAMVGRDHPRILFRPGDFERLGGRLAAADFAEHWEAVLAVADSYRERPVPPIEVPPDFYCDYRAQTPEHVARHFAIQQPVEANLAVVRNSGLAYRVTGEGRYRDDAVQAMRALAAIDLPSTTYSVTHCFCHLIPALSVGLDWLWDEFEPEEREGIIAGLVERTRDFFPLSLGVALDNPLDSHGWEYGLVGSTYAALALLHHAPEAEEWLRTVLLFMERCFPGFGGDDGGWGQGIAYGADIDAQLVMHLLWLAIGVNFFDTPWARNSGRVRLYFQTPYANCPSFGDASYLYRPGERRQVMQIYAMTAQEAHYQWYADQIEAPFFGGGYFFSSEYFVSHFLHWGPRPTARPPDDLPQSLHLRDVDWVALHAHMGDRERHVALQFKSSHFGSFNHSHADQNSFLLEAFGQPLLIDSGYYPWYGSEHDVQWARQTRAHNALLLNGKGQGVWNRAAAGRIVSFVDGGEVAYVAGDATAAYQQPSAEPLRALCAAEEGVVRAVRHLVYVRPHLFVVLDDVETREPAEVTFLLHAVNAFGIDEAGRVAEVRNGAAMARVHVLSDEPVTITQTDQFTVPPEPQGHDTGPNQWHLSAVFAATECRRRLITVITVGRVGREDELVSAEPLFGSRSVGALVGAVAVQFRLHPAGVKVRCQGPSVDFEFVGPPTG